MNRKSLSIAVFFIAAAFVLSASLSHAAGDLKIGVFDMQKVIRDSKAGQEARGAFEKDLSEKRAALAAKEENLRALQEDLAKVTKPADEAAKKQKKENMESGIKDLSRLRVEMETELRKRDEELTMGLIKGVMAVVNEIGQKEKFTMILQKVPNVAYLDSAIDITPKVLEKYNAQNDKK